MHSTSANQLILSYIEGWIAGNREQILSTLGPACLVIESYGPTYRGKEMVGRWIDSWFAPAHGMRNEAVEELNTVLACGYHPERGSLRVE
jgi:hypothetical protein